MGKYVKDEKDRRREREEWKEARQGDWYHIKKGAKNSTKRVAHHVSRGVKTAGKVGKKGFSIANNTVDISKNLSSRIGSISSGSNLIVRILSVVVLILLISTIFRHLNGNFVIPRFSSLFTRLATLPKIQVPLATSWFVIGDWGMFNFLADIIRFAQNILNVLVFVFNSLATFVSYFVAVMSWITGYYV